MRLFLVFFILCFKVLYAEPVVIKSVSLDAGSNEITITGENFDTACRVYIEAGGPYVVGSIKTNDFALNSLDTADYTSKECVSGSYAYVANESGVQIMNVSKPANPVKSGRINMQGQVAGVSVVGNYAYIAEGNSGLQVVDISNPAKPKVASKLNIAGAKGIFVSGDCAYIIDGAGLKIVDVSNRVNPNIVDIIDTSGYMGTIDTSNPKICVVDNYTYIMSNIGDLQIIDTSNPSDHKVVGSISCKSDPSGIDVAGSYVYIADGILGLGIVYVENRADPRMVGHISTYGNVTAVQAIGNYACVADGNTGMKVIDIRNKAVKNRIAGGVGTPGYASGIYVLSPFAYVADQRGGLQVVDISSPDNPVIASSVGAYYASKVFVANKYIYVADWNSVIVLHKSSTTDLLRQAKVINDKTIKSVVSKELLPGKYNIKIINSSNELAVLHNKLTIN